MSTPCVGIGCLSGVYNRCRDVIMAITIDREFKSLLFSGHTATSRALTALDTASKGKSLLADLAFSPDVSHDSSSTIG